MIPRPKLTVYRIYHLNYIVAFHFIVTIFCSIDPFHRSICFVWTEKPAKLLLFNILRSLYSFWEPNNIHRNWLLKKIIRICFVYTKLVFSSAEMHLKWYYFLTREVYSKINSLSRSVDIKAELLLCDQIPLQAVNIVLSLIITSSPIRVSGYQ